MIEEKLYVQQLKKIIKNIRKIKSSTLQNCQKWLKLNESVWTKMALKIAIEKNLQKITNIYKQLNHFRNISIFLSKKH